MALETRYLVWTITDPEQSQPTTEFVAGSWSNPEDAETYISAVSPTGPEGLYYNVISAERWVEE